MTGARRLAAGPVAAALVAALAVPAAAYDHGGGGTGTSTGTSITSQVRLTVNSGGGQGVQHLTADDTSWTPPPCWFEPRFTAEQYQAYWENEILPAAGSFKQYVYPQYEALKAIDFNKGKDGLWWGLTFANRAWDLPSYEQCFQKAGETWVTPAGPPAGVPAVTPQLLSRIAYAATKLPSVQVALSPAADSQVVNLPTYVKLDQPLAPVSVTAQLDVLGVRIAASTLAVPVSLQVDAGTDEAAPSRCTYPMAKAGGSYQVNSEGSGCNITYQRATNGKRYPLTGRITWKVTWTASANPYAAPTGALPDGTSTSTPQDVAVKEIQTVVTG
ncbi:hypothetical protein [Kitasatospora sp. KL5]|uniref:hypothetical protein n=1 Tax=Kitasatospora sp. KL5 TaxID=3425125 RepID=UPI003D6EDBCF